MINTSGIVPVGHRVLIKPDKIKNVTDSGIMLNTPSQEEREQLASHRGVVVAIGSSAYADQKEPWCKIGDRVTYAKYAGLIYKEKETADGLEYRVINDLDVVGRHEEL